ncbi:hypothetical protein [Streptomyces griseoluteus]|uniref:hypothetical protein n=1 Tax=Streptomyces griseoluteus TaxID=29306 RepID=UPI0037F5EBB5
MTIRLLLLVQGITGAAALGVHFRHRLPKHLLDEPLLSGLRNQMGNDDNRHDNYSLNRVLLSPASAAAEGWYSTTELHKLVVHPGVVATVEAIRVLTSGDVPTTEAAFIGVLCRDHMGTGSADRRDSR